ncbi:MAG: DMT family transporter [Bacillota bacterium]
MLEYIAVLAAGTIWAAGGLLVRYLQLHGLKAMTIALLRLCSAWLIYTAWILSTDRKLFRVERKHLPFLLLLGAVGPAGSQPLFITAVTLTTVAVATILNYTAPLFVIILARLFLGETITGRKVVALAFTIGGLVLVTGVYRTGGTVSLPAFASGLASGFLYATYTMLLKRVVVQYNPITLQWWSSLFGIPILAVYSLPSLAGQNFNLPPLGWAAVAALAIGPGFTAFVLFTWALSRTQASRVAIAANIEPVAAALLGVIVLGERLGFGEILGVCMVLAGIAIASVPNHERVRPDRPASSQPSCTM